MISEVSKRYARALFDLAQEANKVDLVLAELRGVSEVFQKSGFMELLASPAVLLEEKESAIKSALGGKVQDLVLQTLLLMLENGRASLFTEVVAAFEESSDQSHGVSRGSVRSAEALGSDRQKQLEAAIFAATQRKVILTYSNDPSILGGLVASVGGWTFDDSLKSHLHRMSEELKRK